MRLAASMYGNQAADEELSSLYGDSRANGFDSEVRTFVQKSFKDAMDKNDILISAAAPSAAYKIGERTNDPLAMYAGEC
ncbi:glutamyl-tRNA(Gln) amidotransferase subunit A, chloroplastic/mitochondrial isoform X2 [Elaeis guineensis]|uniref:glutamyl-tRNA(Gln) amidotransferase subunit A, chloroplastic/mitochondrial isoform X2 n=1 Tax=Elaeis guineensis var. tenera TaxID=51953 RepID=UPI00094F8405